MMKHQWKLSLLILFIVLSFTINIFGLMHLYPIYLTSPLLFLSLLLMVHYINNRKKFRGFKS
ncbi:hypothetical protein D3H55_23190 [Bacillus salacetis]|uniref:Uncharacterized protein n=1 Tax=Bacillus salacetis TaxID=2315464 RepID=A0A3A1QLH8_9BACI|nr:hypothetical protein [Bacillus salacetis]RIW27244.1 hypothetical protein D3H55_23190 [Bacillus salacetis]